MRKKMKLVLLIYSLLVCLTGCKFNVVQSNDRIHQEKLILDNIMISDYESDLSVEINSNKPFFSADQLTTESFEEYSSLDEYGRAGSAFACFCKDMMPTVERGDISSISPTGWQQNYYSEAVVETEYLMSRCHLLMRAVGGDDSINNIIAGTSYFNKEGMLPYETQLLNLIKTQNIHVMYRVTPLFEGENLFAKGVLMEAMSVEDQGTSLEFCVFVYNVQPGISIDYKTGYNWIEGAEEVNNTYVLNNNTYKFHLESCEYVKQIAQKNKQVSTSTKAELLHLGYTPCGSCRP